MRYTRFSLSAWIAGTALVGLSACGGASQQAKPKPVSAAEAAPGATTSDMANHAAVTPTPGDTPPRAHPEAAPTAGTEAPATAGSERAAPTADAKAMSITGTPSSTTVGTTGTMPREGEDAPAAPQPAPAPVAQAPAAAAQPALTATRGETPAAARQHSDKNFLTRAAFANAAEIGLGRLALQKSQNPRVKEYAQQMIDAHSAASRELVQLAVQKGVIVPTDMDAQHRNAWRRLGGLSGAAFDREYLRLQLEDHVKTTELFRAQSQTGQDADIKAWAGKMLPHLESHLKQAQELSAGGVS